MKCTKPLKLGFHISYSKERNIHRPCSSRYLLYL